MAFSFINNNLSLSQSSLDCDFGVNQLQQSGNIVYEYNPLKVLRLDSDVYNSKGEVETPRGTLVDLDTKEHLKLFYSEYFYKTYEEAVEEGILHTLKLIKND